jgi:hypothetical protein
MTNTQYSHDTYIANVRYVQIKVGVYSLNITLKNDLGVVKKYKTTTTDLYLIDDMRDNDDDIKWGARQRAIELVCKKNQLPVLFYHRDNATIQVSLDV